MLDNKNGRKKMARGSAMLAVGTVVTLLAGTAQGQEAVEDKMFSFSGFGTLGVTHSTISSGDYVGNLSQPSGAGRSHSYDVGTDTRLGGQVDAKLSNQLSAVLQIVAQEQTNNVFSPRVEWANLKYAFTPDFSMRVGRTALPSYLTSESRLVGYSNPWIRPPVESYSANPLTNVDGVDMAYRQHFGSVNNTVQSWYGKTQANAVTGSGYVVQDLRATKLYGVADTVEFGSLTLHSAWTQGSFVFPLQTYTVRQLVRQYNLGALYDPGNWFVQSEATVTDTGIVTAKMKAFYVTGGYRIQAFTPYATFSQVKADSSSSGVKHSQHTTSLGVRWDVAKNTDIKLQFDHIQLGQGSAGFFTNATTALLGTSGNVASLVVDFVF